MSIIPGRVIPEAIRTLFSGRVTSRYPDEEPDKPDRFRGRLEFDESNCTGCGLCARNCPANALEVTREEDGTITWRYDVSKCIYCGQCIETCPIGAVTNTKEFELAADDKGEFVREQQFKRE
jgi:formate hydrogenlyase subunit 6/NADH:ubiquinone oxidoreductase subunit I